MHEYKSQYQGGVRCDGWRGDGNTVRGEVFVEIENIKNVLTNLSQLTLDLPPVVFDHRNLNLVPF